MLLGSVCSSSPHLYAAGGQRKEMLLLVLVGDNHRRPPRGSNKVNSKGKPDLDREIRKRALQLAGAG